MNNQKLITNIYNSYLSNPFLPVTQLEKNKSEFISIIREVIEVNNLSVDTETVSDLIQILDTTYSDHNYPEGLQDDQFDRWEDYNQALEYEDEAELSSFHKHLELTDLVIAYYIEHLDRLLGDDSFDEPFDDDAGHFSVVDPATSWPW